MRSKRKLLIALGVVVLVAALSVASVAAQAAPSAQATPNAGPPAASGGWTCPCVDGTAPLNGPRGGMMGGYGIGPIGPVWAGDNVAKVLGMTEEQILAELRAGKSLVQIAEAKGVSKDALAEAILADHKVKLDAAVAAGRLTKEQANAMAERMQAQVKAMLESGLVGPMGGAGRWGMMGPRYQNQDGLQAPFQGNGPMGRGWRSQGGTQSPAPQMTPGMMGRWGSRA